LIKFILKSYSIFNYNNASFLLLLLGFFASILLSSSDSISLSGAILYILPFVFFHSFLQVSFISISRESPIYLNRFFNVLFILIFCVSLIQYFDYQRLFLNFFDYFYGGSRLVNSSYTKFAQVYGDRVTGIFSQPGEAGLVFGIFLFFYIFNKRSLYNYFFIACSVAGGYLTNTKIFFGIAVLSFLYYLLSKFHLKKVILYSIIPVALSLLLSFYFGFVDDFYNYFLYSRYSSYFASELAVISFNPFFGIGYNSLYSYGDSMYVSLLLFGGLFLLIIFFNYIFSCLWLAYRFNSYHSIFLILIILSASIGFPIFLQYKSTMILLLIFNYLVLYRFNSPNYTRRHNDF